MTITPETIVELKRLAAAATPGPWEVRGNNYHSWVEASGTPILEPMTHDETDFVVAMRNALPALLAAAEENVRLRAVLGHLLEVYSKPDERMCCDGRECGCMGATVHEHAEYIARAAVEAIEAPKGDA